MTPMLLWFSHFSYHVVQESALRTIGNIVTSKEKHVKKVIDSGILSHFALLLAHHNTNIQKVRSEVFSVNVNA